MMILETDLGDFFVNNAVRIDFTKEKEREVWLISLAIDSYKFPLHRFECQQDANLFKETMRSNFFRELNNDNIYLFRSVSLLRLCESAFKTVEETIDDNSTRSK